MVLGAQRSVSILYLFVFVYKYMLVMCFSDETVVVGAELHGSGSRSRYMVYLPIHPLWSCNNQVKIANIARGTTDPWYSI